MDIKVTKKQRMFMDSREDEVLYGGAAGGGKSYVQIIDNLTYAAEYPGIKQLILRRTFPELERSLIRTFHELYPKELYTYNQSKHTMRFKNGSLTDFGFCKDESDVYQYQSSEYDIIRIDEATHFTGGMYLYLKSRVRGANKFPKQMKSSTNPGNVGHTFFKSRFIDVAPPMSVYHAPPSVRGAVSTRLFIPAKVRDNSFLLAADPDYEARLEDLPTEQRKALLDGSWDLYEGQFFPEFDRKVHVIKPLGRLDKDVRVYFTLDYGLDMFAGYWVAVGRHDRCYVIGEIYEPNVVISSAAALIKEREKELGIKTDQYLGPSDMWARRQESARSVADIFYENGIRLHKTSRDRIDGWAAVKEYLKVYTDELNQPNANLKIYDTCVNLIRCLPALQYDPNRPSDAATVPHEITHAPDALRGFCVYRSRANRAQLAPTQESMATDIEYRHFNSPDLFDVYGSRRSGREDDSYDPYNSSSGSYNPMYI